LHEVIGLQPAEIYARCDIIGVPDNSMITGRLRFVDQDFDLAAQDIVDFEGDLG